MYMSEQEDVAYVQEPMPTLKSQRLNLDACIGGRRSVRGYTDEPVSKEQIEAVLEAGVWAPTALDREPWRFIIIEDRELIRYVSEETKSLLQRMRSMIAKRFQTGTDVLCYDAPVLILVCAQKEEEEYLNHLNLIDGVLAAQNMFLKAFELGLGTCYTGSINLLSYKPEVLKKVGLPDGYELIVPFVLGHPKTKQAAGRRNKPQVLRWTR